MESTAAKPEGEDDIHDFLKNIPACIRCRQNHRRCDPSLPSCRNCVKAGHQECVYFDPILGEQVERSRVMALATRLRTLRAVSVGSALSSAVSATGPSRPDSRRLYLGSRARVPKSLKVPAPHAEEDASVFDFPAFLTDLYDIGPPSTELHSFLLKNYRTNINALYPVLDEDDPLLDPHRSYKAEESPVHQFRLNMIYSTSCLCVSSRFQSQSILPLSRTFHRKAMDHVDDATSEVSVEVLRNFAIMALNSLFAPDQGNLNQLVGLACRMCVDLELSRSEDRSLYTLYLAILNMERQLAVTLDRPLFMARPSHGQISERSEPVEILWSLLSIQCALQRGPSEGRNEGKGIDENLRSISSFLESREPSPPSLMSTLRETELMFVEHRGSDDAGSLRTAASKVLLAHDAPFLLRSCLSPHWTFRACDVFLKHCSGNLLAKAPHEVQIGLILLDRDAGRWPSCKYFVDQLRSI